MDEEQKKSKIIEQLIAEMYLKRDRKEDDKAVPRPLIPFPYVPRPPVIIHMPMPYQGFPDRM